MVRSHFSHLQMKRSRSGQQRISTVPLFSLGVDDASLVAILKELTQQDALSDGLQDASRKVIRHARDALLRHSGRYGPLFHHIDLEIDGGGTYKWKCANLFALIDWLVSECPSFRQLIEDCQAHCPSSPLRPWGLIIFMDEFIPGNPLKDFARQHMVSACPADSSA